MKLWKCNCGRIFDSPVTGAHTNEPGRPWAGICYATPVEITVVEIREPQSPEEEATCRRAVRGDLQTQINAITGDSSLSCAALSVRVDQAATTAKYAMDKADALEAKFDTHIHNWLAGRPETTTWLGPRHKLGDCAICDEQRRGGHE